jgi:hypothetical protein
MSWVEAGVFNDGLGGTKCKVLIAEDHVYEQTETYNNVVQGFQIAQRTMTAATEVLAISGQWNHFLSAEDWLRLQWAAWKAFGCFVNKEISMSTGRTSVFTSEQQLRVDDAFDQVKAGLTGGGTVIVKVGFPGLRGLVCRAFFGVRGMYLGGLVKPHAAIGTGKEPTGTWLGIPTVQGEIHISVKDVSSRWGEVNHAEIAETLIHEAYHKYAELVDKFYLSGYDLHGRGKDKSRACFKNADSHSKFCMVVAGEYEKMLQRDAECKGWDKSAEYKVLKGEN